jgi:hypothetical protein
MALLGFCFLSLPATAQKFKIGFSLAATNHTWTVANANVPEINRNTIGLSGLAAPEIATYTRRWGFQLGLPILLQFQDEISLSSGLFLTQKNLGSSINRNSFELEEQIDLEMTAYYFKIPVELRYTIPLNKKQSVFIGGGVYLGLGLGGDYSAQIDVLRYTGEFEGIEDREIFGSVDFTTGIDQGNVTEYVVSTAYFLNFIDVGLSFNLGYQWGKFYTRAAYDFGLIDTDPVFLINIVDETVTNRYNRTFILEVGCYF